LAITMRPRLLRGLLILGLSCLSITLALGGFSLVFAQSPQAPPVSSTASSAATAVPRIEVSQAQTAQPAAPPPAAPQAAPRSANINPSTLLALIRTTLIVLDEANKTGNYSLLRDAGAPGFAAANSVKKLADIFANQRRQQLNMSGVAVDAPQLTMQPRIEPNGMLHFAGFFPAGPSSQLKFEMLFQPVNGRWQLFGLAVNLAQGAPPNVATAAPIPQQANVQIPVAKPGAIKPKHKWIRHKTKAKSAAKPHVTPDTQ
jgi:hypothetical protein